MHKKKESSDTCSKQVLVNVIMLVFERKFIAHIQVAPTPKRVWKPQFKLKF